MANNNTQQPPAEVIDEQTVFSMADLCRSCSVEAEFIEAMVEQGIIEPSGSRATHWCFTASSLRRTRVTLHLQKDLGVNLAGAALALDLLDHIEQIESRLRRLAAASGSQVDVRDI